MILTPDVLLIDADILAYQAAALAQLIVDWDDNEDPQVFTDPEKAERTIDQRLDEYMDALDCSSIILCLSDDVNWRKQLWPEYKAHRKDITKPKLLQGCKKYMNDQYHCLTIHRLEADDVMGILSTSGEYEFPVIVSIDKDMKTIPGWLYNPDRDDRPVFISREEAVFWHMRQTLTGDSTDGYKGCPGIGPKKADALLGKIPEKLDDKQFHEWRIKLWQLIVKTYKAKNLKEQEALLNSRLAHILQAGSWNRETSKVKLWKAPC